MILYFIGRVGGGKLLAWLLNDKEQVEKCKRLLARGWVFYPIGMLLPLPDDIISVLAGTSKMKWWFVAICSLVTRGIDTACSVFGFGLLTKYWWGWIILGVGVILLALLTIAFYKIDKRMREKEKESNEVKHEHN